MAAAKPVTALPNAAPVIQGAIMQAFGESAPILKNYARRQVSIACSGAAPGAWPRQSTARARRIRRGGSLAVGTPVIYGRFWEFGWKRGGKSSRRQWLRPAVDQAMPEITRRVESHLNRAMASYSGSVTIDIKIT